MNRPTTTSSGGAFTYVDWPDRPIFSQEQVVQISYLSAEAGMWHHSVALLTYGNIHKVYGPNPAMKRRWRACFGRRKPRVSQEQRIMMAALMLTMCASELREMFGDAT